MALTAIQMASLLAGKGGGATDMAFVDGKWQTAKITGTTVGAFQGRTGTITRNRKGRTSRKPDGWVKYCKVDVTVQAYMATKVVR